MKPTRTRKSNRTRLELHRATLRVLSEGGLAKVAAGIMTEIPECSSSITKPLGMCHL